MPTSFDALDASAATPIEGSNGFDFVENTFGKPGDRRDIPAVNVNTMDEVPDPYGGPDEGYDRTIAMVRSAAAGLIETMASARMEDPVALE